MATHSRQTYSDRWFQYLKDRRDPDLAVRVLTKPYQPLDPIFDDFDRSYSNMEIGRFKAEEKFFRDHSRAAEDLLESIVCQRYHAPGCRPVDLRRSNARQFISAARLYHEKLIILCDANDDQYAQRTYPGLPIGSQNGPRGPFYGPSESYILGSEFGRQVVRCKHRTDSLCGAKGPLSVRLGNCFVDGVGSYGEIRDKLDHIMWKLGDSQKRLVDIFRHFTRTHEIMALPELNFSETADLATICFLILEVEQSQWQSALFFRGDNKINWKLGMSVSFARLIRLFRDEHISLDELFFEYPLYSTKNLRDRCPEVRDTCTRIDALFRNVYGGSFGRDRAMDDLYFLYGNY